MELSPLCNLGVGFCLTPYLYVLIKVVIFTKNKNLVYFIVRSIKYLYKGYFNTRMYHSLNILYCVSALILLYFFTSILTITEEKAFLIYA